MASADPASSTPTESGEAPRPRSRIGRVFSGSRELVRIAYRDPEHIAERLTLYVTDRYGDSSREWAASARAARPETPPAVIAEELRVRSAQVARIDGAISGTPFFIALVPGYLTYLLQETRMTLRTAALYGHDPRTLRAAAEGLTLRGVHPSVASAEAALTTVREKKLPDRPAQRRSLHTWVHSGYQLLVFGGFLSPSSEKPKGGVRERIRAVLSVVLGFAIWVTTWVLPVTFMIMMAWGCETHARQLGRRALVFYDGEEDSVDAAIADADKRRDHGHDARSILRTIALVLSVAIPIGFIALAQHVRKTVGFNWLVALGAVVAFSLVMATAVIASRR
jgi:hypothetical protein